MLLTMLDQYQTGSSGSPLGTLIALLLAVLLIAAQWKVFTKAGEPGWAALIPIYSTLVLLRICGRPWWWLLLLLIPLVNIVIAFVVIHDLAVSFGKGWPFALGLIFLSIIFYPILGFGSAAYDGPAAA